MDVSLVELDGDLEYGIITTQTCDITEEDSATPRKPWVQVSPVYRYEGPTEKEREAINRYAIPDLAHLTGKHFAEEFYVADLRLSIPLEKSLLVGRESISGFASEPDAMGFAEHCSAYLSRPALPGKVVRLVVRHINRYFEGKPALRTQIRNAGVDDVRLRLGGTEDVPIVQLMVILKEANLTDMSAASAAFEQWLNAAKQSAQSKNEAITFIGTQFTTMRDASAEQFANSIRLRSDNIL
jgi:hypothetical protein